MIRRYFVLILVLFSFSASHAQSREGQVKAINNFVQFANESIHGMLIVHRLLEGYNQKINKYVDLEGYQLNFYANSDLPKDIFEDPDKWFYEISPKQWYSIALHEKSSIPGSNASLLVNIMTKMRDETTAVNALRFEIEDYIDNHDLNNKSSLDGVYQLLEKGVNHYDNFFKSLLSLERVLSDLEKQLNTDQKGLVSSFKKMNAYAKQGLRALRTKSDQHFEKRISNFRSAKEEVLSNSIFVGSRERSLLNLEKKANLYLQKLEEYHNTAMVPKEYNLYGKFYYYHNVEASSCINRYGNGYVKEANKWMAKNAKNAIWLTEEPDFFQVIYPKKMITDEYISSTDDLIEDAPTSLKDREITPIAEVILVDSIEFELSLYDHKIIDGDLISLNFNGDWILENYSLEGSQKKLKLRLNENGKNYIIIHADNVGRRPPNTLTIAYYHLGKRKEIELESNLNESAMVEIKKNKSLELTQEN